MKCKAQWNVTLSWQKGKNPCQDSWSSHRKTTFIGTRPETNNTELSNSLISCFKYESLRASRKGSLPFSESQGKAEFHHCFYSSQKEEIFIPRKNMHEASDDMHGKRERSILYMHILSFLETFLSLPDTNESFACNGYDSIVILWGCFHFTVSSRRMRRQFVFPVLETDLLPFLLISGIYRMAIVLHKIHSHMLTNCFQFPW